MIYRGGDRDTIEQRKGSFKPYDASEEPYFTDDDAAKAANRCTGVDQRTRSQLPQLDRARAHVVREESKHWQTHRPDQQKLENDFSDV